MGREITHFSTHLTKNSFNPHSVMAGTAGTMECGHTLSCTSTFYELEHVPLIIAECQSRAVLSFSLEWLSKEVADAVLFAA